MSTEQPSTKSKSTKSPAKADNQPQQISIDTISNAIDSGDLDYDAIYQLLVAKQAANEARLKAEHEAKLNQYKDNLLDCIGDTKLFKTGAEELKFIIEAVLNKFSGSLPDNQIGSIVIGSALAHLKSVDAKATLQQLGIIRPPSVAGGARAPRGDTGTSRKTLDRLTAIVPGHEQDQAYWYYTGRIPNLIQQELAALGIKPTGKGGGYTIHDLPGSWLALAKTRREEATKGLPLPL